MTNQNFTLSNKVQHHSIIENVQKNNLCVFVDGSLVSPINVCVCSIFLFLTPVCARVCCIWCVMVLHMLCKEGGRRSGVRLCVSPTYILMNVATLWHLCNV